MNPPINQKINILSDVLFVKGTFSYSYKSFFESVLGIEKYLRLNGIKEDDIVILYDMNPEKTLFLLFALINLKAIAFPVDPKMTRKELISLKNASKASFILSDSLEETDTLNPSEIFEEAKKEESSLKKQSWDFEKPAIIILTSGSSGEPKMAVHSLNNLMFSAKTVNTYFDIKEKENWLLSLPLYHVAGLAIVFRCLLSDASLSIPVNKMDISDSLEKYRPTYLSLVPTQLWRIFSDNNSIKILKQCKMIFLGGSSIQFSLIKKSLENNLHLFTSYGLTEMASTVAIKKIMDNSTERAEILPSYQVKISKEKEIFLKGDALFLGYLENGVVKQKLNNENWFETGDLGSIHQKNMITVFGRKDNMFISGGENVYPEEIEKYLLMIDTIEEAVVVDVDDDEFGSRPIAFIKMFNKINSTEIVSHLKQHLPSYKIPDQFLPWPEDHFEDDEKVKRQYFKSLL